MTRMADVGGCCSQTEAVTSARLLESLCHSHASGIVFNFLFVQMRVCVWGGGVLGATVDFKSNVAPHVLDSC